MTTVLDAWQAALAAEQQAAFGYALLGPHVPAAQQESARACQAAHEAVRDATASAIAATGAVPVAPQGDYPALYPLSRAPVRLAAQLEDECAEAWRFLYATAAASGGSSVSSGSSRSSVSMPSDTALRGQAQQMLTASAVRATRWRLVGNDPRPVQAFPGIPAR